MPLLVSYKIPVSLPLVSSSFFYLFLLFFRVPYCFSTSSPRWLFDCTAHTGPQKSTTELGKLYFTLYSVDLSFCVLRYSLAYKSFWSYTYKPYEELIKISLVTAFSCTTVVFRYDLLDLMVYIYFTAMQHTLLKDVNRQSYGWKVLVRLARLWEFRDHQTGTILYELDFVVVDRQVRFYSTC